MYKICWKQNTLKKIQGIVSFFHVKFLRIISEYLRILNDIRSWYLTQLTDIDMKTSIQSFVYESQTIIIGKETFILRKFEAFASNFRECLEEIFPRDACSKYNLQSHMLPVAKGLTQQKVNAVTKTLHGTSIFFMWMNCEFQGKLDMLTINLRKCLDILLSRHASSKFRCKLVTLVTGNTLLKIEDSNLLKISLYM